MTRITIYPKNKKQENLLKDLLEELRVKFEVGLTDDSLLSEEDFFNKIDTSLQEAERGKTKKLSKESQKEFLGL